MTSVSRATAMVVCLLWPAGHVSAADEAAGTPTNAIGAIKSWNAEVQPGQTPADLGLTPESMSYVKRINGYFSDLTHLEGRFVQTDPDNAQTRGRFYVQRPGLLRFDYAPPSKLRIVADGEYLSIEDHDLNTVDKYPLDSTPFRMLLAADVDLFRDANIVSFAQRDRLLALTLEDKTGESAGLIKLFFEMKQDSSALELKEWVITDPQGLDTRIEVVDVVSGEEKERDFFNTTSVAFPTFSD